MQKCSAVMTTDPVYCLPDETAEVAAQRMKAEAIGSLPVIADEGTMRPVGIITDRILALEIVAGGRDAESTPVEELMTRDPITCRAQDDLDKAVHAMSDHHVRRIPIVDESGRLVGIIAQADLTESADKPSLTAEIIVESLEPL